MCIQMSVLVYAMVVTQGDQKMVLDLSGAGIMFVCELSNVSSGNQTGILQQSSKHSYLLNPFSSLRNVLNDIQNSKSFPKKFNFTSPDPSGEFTLPVLAGISLSKGNAILNYLLIYGLQDGYMVYYQAESQCHFHCISSLSDQCIISDQ